MSVHPQRCAKDKPLVRKTNNTHAFRNFIHRFACVIESVLCLIELIRHFKFAIIVAGNTKVKIYHSVLLEYYVSTIVRIVLIHFKFKRILLVAEGLLTCPTV